MYISQYNQINSQINHLFDMLDNIRENIGHITNIHLNRSPPLRENYRRNSNTYMSRYIDNLINEERQNNYVFYDYNSPINPSIYNTNPLGRGNSGDSRNRQNSSGFRNNDIDISNFLSNFFNTSVIIRPTNEQIQNASRIIRFGDISNPLSETCPISLERFDNDDMVRQILHCGHIFCQNQFQEWFNNNVRCPVCRYDIRNYRPSATNNSVNSNNQPLEDDEQSLIDDELNEESPNSENNIPNHHQNNENPIREQSNPFSNVNVSRNPDTNQIDQIAFDITNNVLNNELLNNITNRMFNSMFNSNNSNDSDRFVFDPSNNILLFETLLRPANRTNNNNNNQNNNNNNNQNNNNPNNN
jgi:hypothetical protein